MSDELGVESSILDQMSLFNETQLKRLNLLLDIKKTRIDFATKHHRNTHGEAMDFRGAHYIKGLYNSLAPEILVIGGTQVMKSEWLIIDHLAAAYNGLSVFFVLRNYDARNAYVQGRLNDTLQTVPFYRRLMKDALVDRQDIKKFGRGKIKYVGSGVEDEFREFPASSVYVEELNDCNWDNVRFGFSRLDGSIFKFKRFVSNSKTKEHPAEKLFEESNQLSWRVPCTACGNRHPLDWHKVVVRPIEDSSGNIVDYVLRDTEWAIGIGRDINCVCPDCGGKMERLSPNGLWLPGNEGAKMDGFHIPSLCSSMVSVGEMWAEFQKAVNDPREMQFFCTRRLAVPYAMVGNKVTSTVMDRGKRDYHMVIQPDRAFIENDMHLGPCCMGIDVGTERLDVNICEALPGGRRRLVFVAKIDTKNIIEIKDLAARYNVLKIVADIQPEQALMTELQETINSDMWLVKVGRSDRSSEEKKNYERRILSVDRTTLLDRTYSAIYGGRTELPENYMEIFGGGYFSEMTSLVREIELDKQGQPFYVWRSNGKDHQRFADAYTFLALKMMDEDYSVITADCIHDFTK